MNKLASGVLLVGVVVACIACGGGGVKLLDGGGDAMMACNPVAQTGCMAGEKCTWVVDIDGTATMDEIGHIGCVADGTVADGGTCTEATATANDNCAKGLFCITRRCKPICDPQLVEGTAAGACAANYACSLYSGVFESAGNSVAGVCEPTCDPLTQKLNVGTTGVEACGSIDPTKPAGTCVVGSGFRSFHCAPTGSMLYTKTDRQAPLADSRGNYFGNGCAPGFIPFYFEDASGSMKTLCSGMCAPLKVDATIAMDAAHKDDNKGDPTALGKLPTDAMAIPNRSVCNVGVKGSEAEQDCRYIWFPLARGDPARAVRSPYNNTLGLCFAYNHFIAIDTNGDNIADAPEKSCAKLLADPPTTDPFGSAKDAGCYPLPNPPALSGPDAVQRNPHRLGSFRFAYGDAPATRHVFD